MSTTAASSAKDASFTQPPALNLVPVKKTALDLFAIAPQVKKMTRREKAQQRFADALQKQQPQKAAASFSSSCAAGDVPAATARRPQKARSAVDCARVRADPSDAIDACGIFQTVLIEDGARSSSALRGDAAKSEEPAAPGTTKKKGRRQLLRHVLHHNTEEDARTVFVGNLPNTVQKKEVEKLFKDCGAIESVRVRGQALEVPDEKSAKAGRAIRVLRGEVKKSDTCSAVAFVLFRDAASVASALGKNTLLFRNRHIVVTTLHTDGAAYPPRTSIFMGNIAYDASEEDVWNFFSEKGLTDVKRVRLVRDRESGDCKGFGYVEFMSPASVEAAIATRGSLLNGREVRIVHVNKSKAVTAAQPSRREVRQAGKLSSRKKQGAVEGAGPRKRPRAEEGGGGRAESSNKPSKAPWMGVMTNPRKKIPKDLRPLLGSDGLKKTGARPPVKRKMRNPEKNQ